MKDLNVLREKVTEMATVMHKAVEVDEKVEQNEVEMMAKLKCENKTLRELLSISGHPRNEIEKLKHKKHLEEDSLLMNGYLESHEDRLVDSSADEMDDGMGTVKRKGKTGATAPSGHTSNNGSVFFEFLGSAGDRSSVVEVKQQYKDENLEGELSRRTDSLSLILQASNIKGNGDSFNIKTGTSSVDEVIPNHIEVSMTEKHDTTFESNDGMTLNFVESSNKGDVSFDKKIDDHWSENVVEKDGKRENNKEGLTAEEELVGSSDSDSKQKQEDFMDLYNSEGILVEENEDNVSKRKSLGHDSKVSGIKFRRSTKQKKVIQADLKSYFQTEEGFDVGVDGEEAVRYDKESDSGKIPAVAETNAARLKKEKDLKVNAEIGETNSELTTGDSSQSDAFAHTAENQIFYGSMMNKELSDVADMEKCGYDEMRNMTGNRIVNIDYNFSPPESPTDGPKFTEREEGKHRTLQLDYSDSDSDDPDVMVEDQFGDISDGSDSSSNDSDVDDDAAGFDDLDFTEEQLIGTLDESGELVVSTWSRSANEYDHLDEEGEPFLLEKTSVDTVMAVDSAALVDSSKAVSNEVPCGMDPSSDELGFSQAFMQQDQFTGGSIEAKFAKRKRYKNASRASAVTLLAGTDVAISPRGNIRSDSDLSLETENQQSVLGSDLGSGSILTRETENQQSDFDQVSGGERAGCKADNTSSDPDLSAGVLSPVRSDTSLTSDSSSGEIDPSIFIQKLAGGGRDRSESQDTTGLESLLSDLDAELELEDSDLS